METKFIDKTDFSKQTEKFNYNGSFPNANGKITGFNVSFNKMDGGCNGNATKGEDGKFIWNFYTVSDLSAIDIVKADVEALYRECEAHIS